METIKKMTQSKPVKRAGWAVINSLMALVVSIITYMATEGNVAWAISVLPFAQAISQFITKEGNKRYLQNG